MRRPRVVIVGAGFGGLSAAKALGGKAIAVTLIDRNNYHTFLPLLYQVATAGLEVESIVYPVRAILRRHRNVDFRLGEVVGVDFEGRRVITDGGPVPYDYLILAAGSAGNYFGNEALAEHTYGLKDIADAEQLRNRVLSNFEAAAREPDAARRRALLTFVIVGGGPTGVEMAGALAELVQAPLREDYPNLDVSEARVVLVEAGDRVLPTFGGGLPRKARRRLERKGVEVRTGTGVEAVTADRVRFGDGSELAAGTVIWAAGVRAAPLADALGTPQARAARVRVQPTLALPDHPEVFVIGDMAYLEGYHGAALPMVSQVAMQQGRTAARNILAAADGRPQRTFRYFDRGNLATIGRRAAILDSHGVRLDGFLAWLGWLFIHLIALIGFRNRLVVLANWAHNYVTYDRGVRLILRQQQG
jgi:NADH dehydrogenase